MYNFVFFMISYPQFILNINLSFIISNLVNKLSPISFYIYFVRDP